MENVADKYFAFDNKEVELDGMITYYNRGKCIGYVWGKKVLKIINGKVSPFKIKGKKVVPDPDK